MLKIKFLGIFHQYTLNGCDVVGEIGGGETTTYLRGINLICTDEYYYVFDAHGDVVNLTDANGNTIKTYDYDAFGVEKNRDENDTNPFRYCGEYWDSETETYYLRARNYDPNLGRFTSEDIHWNVSNMIYGDNPQKINEREDKLGLKTYSYAPSISAIVQSGNLYVYCANDPVDYMDLNGEEFVLALVGGGLVGAASATGAANLWNPVGWALLTVVAVLAVCCVVDYTLSNRKNNPIDLPSIKNVKIDMDHIMSGHSEGGNRGGPNKDRFPWWMTEPMIEKIIREVYKNAEKIGQMQFSWQDGVEKVRQLFQGSYDGMIVQFWYNYTDKIIESAWPK